MNIVFDLDGTLIDSAPDIQAACNKVLADEGARPVDMKTLISFIGNGIPKLVERAIKARDLDIADHERLTQKMLDYYGADPATLSKLYNGIETLLPALKAEHHHLGICTNKPLEPTMAILDLYGITKHFDVIIGGDTLPVKKPNPAPLVAAFKALGDGQRLYVGDSEVDAETADKARVPFALFTEGYRKVAVADLPKTYTFSTFEDFAEVVRQHRL